MNDSTPAPQEQIFAARANTVALRKGLAISVFAVSVGLVLAFPSVWGAAIGITVSLAAWRMAAQRANTTLRFGEKALSMTDSSGQHRWSSVLPYEDISEVLRVPGKGVGVRLLSPARWLASFDGGKLLEGMWKRLHEEWRKSKGVDLWMPDFLLAPGPEAFAEALEKKRAQHASLAAPSALNFDKVEFQGSPAASGLPASSDPSQPSDSASTQASCASCRNPVALEYYELNGGILCPECARAVEALLLSPQGRLGRVGMAFLWGALGAGVGSAIFAGVAIGTGYELGLISLLAGWLGGAGVRRGSKGRGGWAYQGLAVFLTYAAISLGYGALVIHEMVKAETPSASEPASKPLAVPAAAAPAKQAKEPVPSKNQALAPAKKKSADEPKQLKPEEAEKAMAEAEAGQPFYLKLLRKMTKNAGNPLVLLALAVLLLFVWMVALPFLLGTQGFMSIIIIAIALWEAWKMNKRGLIALNGPFSLSGQAPAAAPPPSLPEPGSAS